MKQIIKKIYDYLWFLSLPLGHEGRYRFFKSSTKNAGKTAFNVLHMGKTLDVTTDYNY